MGRISREANKERDLVEKISSMPDQIAEGRVTVRLIDPDTGRVKHEDGGTNFIAIPAIERFKALTRFNLGHHHPNYTNTTEGSSPLQIPPDPMTHLACWNDSSAEDSATETGVMAPVTAWASRWPIGSPANLRGVVDLTASEMTDAYAKWVFNWTPAQGNGTFRSVGWTRMDENHSIPYTRFPGTYADYIPLSNTHTSGWDQVGGFWWDGTDWVSVETPTASYSVRTYPVAGGASNATVWTGVTNFASTSQDLMSICKISTDFYICGSIVSSNPRVGKYNSSGTQQWTRSETTIATNHSYHDITTDGSNLWVGCSDGNIYRLSTSDGTIAATITPALPNATVTGTTTGASQAMYNGVIGVAYDASDSNMWIAISPAPASSVTVGEVVVYKINPTTGAVVASPQISFFGAGKVETASSPYAGSMYTGTSNFLEYSVIGSGAASTGTTTAPVAHVMSQRFYSPLGRMCMKSTDLYMSTGAPGANSAYTGGIKGLVKITSPYNLGTRKLLGANVVKTSADAMQISYQFTFS